MDSSRISDLILAASQDVYELVLTGHLDLASKDGRSAAALSHETFRERMRSRPPLHTLDLAHTKRGREVFAEVTAFVFGWVDGFFQLSSANAEWLGARQSCYRDVLLAMAAPGVFPESEIQDLDELVVTRAAEYGPELRNAPLLLSTHLTPIFGEASLILASSAAAYVVGASVELASELEPAE